MSGKTSFKNLLKAGGGSSAAATQRGRVQQLKAGSSGVALPPAKVARTQAPAEASSTSVVPRAAAPS